MKPDGQAQMDDLPMGTPSREEFDAELEAIEARIDGRLAAIQASIHGFVGRMEECALQTDQRFARTESALDETQASIRNLEQHDRHCAERRHRDRSWCGCV